jgi:hypothetical protein
VLSVSNRKSKFENSPHHCMHCSEFSPKAECEHAWSQAAAHFANQAPPGPSNGWPDANCKLSAAASEAVLAAPNTFLTAAMVAAETQKAEPRQAAHLKTAQLCAASQ